jgi:hypothetical protein
MLPRLSGDERSTLDVGVEWKLRPHALRGIKLAVVRARYAQRGVVVPATAHVNRPRCLRPSHHLRSCLQR